MTLSRDNEYRRARYVSHAGERASLQNYSLFHKEAKALHQILLAGIPLTIKELPAHIHTLRSLWRKGLINYIYDGKYDRVELSDQGIKLMKHLGSVPRSFITNAPMYDFVGECDTCRNWYTYTLIAWDSYDYSTDLGESYLCIKCVLDHDSELVLNYRDGIVPSVKSLKEVPF